LREREGSTPEAREIEGGAAAKALTLLSLNTLSRGAGDGL
jgi:hypothetical protein